MLKRFAAAFACTFAILASGCSDNTPTTPSANREIVIGMELAYPPFEGKDLAGRPAGVSPDFAAEFARRTGRIVRIENIAFDGLIPALVTGRVDAVMSSMTATAERAKTVDFTAPYAHARLAVLTSAARPAADLKDLNRPERTIALKIGSTGHLFAARHLPQAKLTLLADESACVMEVVTGKADGFIYDQLTVYRNHQKNPKTTATLFLKDAEAEPWAIAVKKGNTALAADFNRLIAEYRTQNGFMKLSEKHLARELQDFRRLGFPWFFDEAGAKN